MLDQFSGNAIHYKVWKLTMAFNGLQYIDMSIRAYIKYICLTYQTYLKDQISFMAIRVSNIS